MAHVAKRLLEQAVFADYSSRLFVLEVLGLARVYQLALGGSDSMDLARPSRARRVTHHGGWQPAIRALLPFVPVTADAATVERVAVVQENVASWWEGIETSR